MQASATTTPTSRLGDQLFALLRRLTLDPESDHLRPVEEHDLTVSQVRALLVLACHEPEPLPGVRIAERLGISAAAISRALDGLVRKGFVTRSESESDRRVRLLRLTDAGRATAEELSALRRAQLDRFVATLDAEQREHLATAFDSLDLQAKGGS